MQNKEYKIRQLNDRYFQKSTFFLYPLLKIPKGVIPMITYLHWDSFYSLDDVVLICRYKKFIDEKQLDVEKNHLIKHIHHLDNYQLEDESVVYVFTFKSFKAVLDLFIKGKYSIFPVECKELIISFYKPESFTRAYIKSYLYPKDYYELYSKLLDIDILLLKNTVELIDVPNIEKEKLLLNIKSLDKDL